MSAVRPTVLPAVRAASVVLAAGLCTLALGAAPVHAQPVPGAGPSAGPGASGVLGGDKGSPGQGSPALGKAAGSPAAGLSALAAAPQLSRSEAIARAQSWVGIGLQYTMDGSTYQGYRRDCSGYVSMSWKLGTPGLDTTSFIPAGVASRIAKDDLKPGDALLNDAAGAKGHVVLFDRWADAAHTSYVGFEFSGSGVHHRTIPYPYFPDYIPAGTSYKPVRNNSIVDDTTPPPTPPTPAPSGTSQSAATVYNPDTGTAEAFAIGADGAMAHAYSTNGGAWTDWSTLDPSFRFTGSPAVVYNPVNKVTEVFATGTDGVVSHNYLFNGGQWSGWSTLGSSFRFGGSPTAVYNEATNAVELFGVGTDGVINHTYNINAGPWAG
ncbi:hypothetical protein ACFC1F_42320, partial [Kitasatospora sp. NPDC056181]